MTGVEGPLPSEQDIKEEPVYIEDVAGLFTDMKVLREVMEEEEFGDVMTFENASAEDRNAANTIIGNVRELQETHPELFDTRESRYANMRNTLIPAFAQVFGILPKEDREKILGVASGVEHTLAGNNFLKKWLYPEGQDPTIRGKRIETVIEKGIDISNLTNRPFSTQR